jgi:hypothetical protein
MKLQLLKSTAGKSYTGKFNELGTMQWRVWRGMEEKLPLFLTLAGPRVGLAAME